MSDIKKQILTLLKQRHHSHKVALEQEKDPRSKHAVDLIARIREDSQLIELIDSLSEEKPSEDIEQAANKFAILYDQGTCDGIAQDCFIAGAKWMRSQMPMPEDTVIFQRGVAEGRRLEREDGGLAWQDIKSIVQIADKMLDDPKARVEYQNHNEEYYYKRVLDEYKKTKEGRR